MAPVIFEDLVLIGPAGSENNLQGWVGAFRARWIAGVALQHDPETWRAGIRNVEKPERNSGGRRIGVDDIRDRYRTGDMHIAVTNPAPDLPVFLRQGDNLYTNSIIVLDVRTGKLRWHRQLVSNDSHDWDVTHATPMFTTTINGATRRLVMTTRQRRHAARGRSRHASVLYSTPMTTRENAETPVIVAAPGLPGRPRRQPVERARLQSRANVLYVPAVDWCATFSAFEQVRYIPGKNYMGGGRTSIRQPSARLADGDRCGEWRSEMEVPLAATDGRGGDDDRR